MLSHFFLNFFIIYVTTNNNSIRARENGDNAKKNVITSEGLIL
jgi:hypothetical protein